MPKQGRRGTRGGVLLLLVCSLLLLWIFRTWFHDFAMALYTRPVIFEALLLWGLLHRFVFSRWSFLTKVRTIKVTGQAGQKPSVAHFRWLWWFSGQAMVVLLVLGLFLAGWARGAILADSLEYKKVATLPQSRQNIRLMPLEVATRYARDSLQLSQFKLGRVALALVDGRLSWTFPLVPDGLVLKFAQKNMGLSVVDATTQQKNASIYEQRLMVGEGMQVTDNLWWHVYRQRYFLTTEKPFYIPADGNELYTVVPAISYKLAQRWGVVCTVPSFAGVFLISNSGEQRFLLPTEAQEHPVLKGNRLFPELLARLYVDVHQFHLGLANKLFIHRDQIQIQDVKSGNRQPFLVATNDGLKWFVSTEPFGASHGIFKVFLVDAVTGEISLFEPPEKAALTGPVRALDYVRKSNPLIDWSRFDLVEPIPYVHGSTLFWKVPIIPGDGAGIAYQAFVNSENNEVTTLSTDAEIVAFVRGEQVTPKKVTEPTSPSETADLIREIRQLLDEVERQLEGNTP